ncbi:MAG TPA: O-antigen ligase family protein [Solirubrobacteraceae bacterium]|nr:O-antigen ligase family protein [Solirubrobacteraceae bacterium]
MDLPLWVRVGVGGGVGLALAYATTPFAISTARRLAFYDVPFGYKGHRAPTPYLGGAAVMAAFIVALLLGVPDQAARTLPLLAGVAVMFILGTIDDRRTVSPQLRVVVELALGALLAADGLGWRLGSGGVLDAVITGVWVVGVVNAFNLFDNMDGAASSMALVVSIGICALGVVTGDVWVAAGSAALAGACLGFLPHNLCSPARIFLGDGGSMPLGFAVAVLAANAARSAEPSSLALLVGFLLVGVPALDTTLVIISRRRRGISVLTGGRDHLTHRTRQRLGTPRRVALALGAAQAIVSAVVILASREGSATLVYIVLAFAVFGACAIVALEDAIPSDADRSGGRAAAAVDGSVPGRSRTRHLPAACLIVIGLGAGLSPLLSAYYDPGLWVPIGLVLVVAAAMAMIARPRRFGPAVTLAVVSLAGLGLWSLLSMGWAAAVEQATVGANLWLTYSALFLLLVVLIRGRQLPEFLLAATGAGIAIVAVSVLVRMLGSNPGALFIAGRLNSPLGYINGEGCVFAMGCWLSLALAERRQPVLAALGAASTVMMASLALLSQSRGAALASVVAAAVVLVAVPGFRRRLMALVLVAAGVVAASSAVLRVYSAGETGDLPASVAHHASAAILAASVLAGLVWGAVVVITNRVSARGGALNVLMRRVSTALAVAVLAAPAGVAIVRLSTIEHTVSRQWHAFVHLSEPSTASATSVQTRLLSGAGNRYDYWRVAWQVFENHPVAGVGAGNYAPFYFRERHTQEAIQNPHSIELQTLSELGVVGLVLLALLLAGTVLGAWRLRGFALVSPRARTIMVAATGVAIVWLVDTSGDWMHLLPGVTAIALAAIAVLCRAADGYATPEEDRRSVTGGGHVTGGGRVTGPARVNPRLVALGAAAAAVLVLAISGASLLRAGLTRLYLNSARGELAAHPAAAIVDAGRALALDSANLDAYYVKAAGIARFDRAAQARATLLQAARQDPENFVTWTLLGDLEVRAGDLRAARQYYRHALSLDHNDPSLAALAADPGRALPAGSRR